MEGTGSANQKWRVEPNADGVCSIVNMSSGKYLDVYDAYPKRGTKLIPWEKNDEDNSEVYTAEC